MHPKTTSYAQGVKLKSYGILPLGYYSWLQNTATGELPILVITSTLDENFETRKMPNVIDNQTQKIKPAFTLCEMLQLLKQFSFYLESDRDYMATVYDKLTQKIFDSPTFLEAANTSLLNSYNQ